MDYVRFVGGSFGTALATNNMEYFKNLNFQHFEELQNPAFINDYIVNTKEFLGVSIDQIKAMFNGYETLMSYSYGFGGVFMQAAHWGAIGSIFVLMLFATKVFKKGKI
jgi:DHA2 family multidrug resistance protein